MWSNKLSFGYVNKCSGTLRKAWLRMMVAMLGEFSHHNQPGSQEALGESHREGKGLFLKPGQAEGRTRILADKQCSTDSKEFNSGPWRLKTASEAILGARPAWSLQLLGRDPLQLTWGLNCHLVCFSLLWAHHFYEILMLLQARWRITRNFSLFSSSHAVTKFIFL